MINLEVEETKADAKMELIAITSDLMPEGKPLFLQVKQYPTIAQLVQQYDKKTMRKVLYLMLKDFCGSLNVKYNMTEDQVIEAAAMLLDECGNFRLEDYQMMFALGKRGQLVDIMHSIDISVIGKMMDEYHLRRANAAEQHREDEEKRINEIQELPTQLLIEAPEATYTFGDVLKKLTEWQNEKGEENEQSQLSEKYKAHQQWLATASAQGVDIEAVRREFSKK